MATKYVILFVTLLAGSLATPIPEQDEDLSMFFSDPDSETRIVGGTAAAAGSHPHMVALTNGLLIRSFFCGGSMITQRSVLTAAHCVANVYSWGSLSSNLRVTVGTNRWNQGGQTYRLARNVTHPNYVSNTIKNDISLLITSSNMVLSQLASPVPLTFDEIPGGVPAMVAGWGRIRLNGASSATLLELTLNTIPGDECVEAAAKANPYLAYHFRLFHKLILPTWETKLNGASSATLLELTLNTIPGDECVESAASAAITLNVRAPPVEPHIEVCTYHSPGHGTCHGDSGSALRRVSDGSQIGVVSWGFPCARGAPDMFVRVSAFQDWLQNHLV